MKTRILIADDHPFIRAGIRSEFVRHDDFEVVAEAETTNKVLEYVGKLPVDVVLLDINMPGVKSIEVVKTIRKNYPQVKTIILTVHSDKGMVLSMLKAGADGYALKDENPNNVLEAVRAVMNGKNWISPTVASYLIGQIGGKSASISDNLLSDRESTVVRLICDGMTTRQIAEQIKMSERTVETHITNIYAKLGVNSRQKVVCWAKENGVA
ncbi:response regulator containing a CheY-like receiver domain and an HTH DNA-binding domain [Longilinea arvoryzae]|uniref:Response regulator containing a CheY-like receiver domain and an HTH DNA-binding domain n=1 Tax=Longilinea arvoryzae TaxID=360412 RepID=A0A0S7B7P0_9CHLR|nr:response regulator transcription factor [Longilinea arvoryzae]GAP13255.1 response regulator containing a CheY-like receiver domain and an HTH DNA-binding domain [Longilinea arvoryzae]